MLEQRIIAASPRSEYAMELVRGVRRTASASTALESTRRLDAGPDADRGPQRPAHRLYEMLWAETSRTRWRSARRCCWPRPVHELSAFVNGLLPTSGTEADADCLTAGLH